jgi:hypothetical protein
MLVKGTATDRQESPLVVAPPDVREDVEKWVQPHPEKTSMVRDGKVYGESDRRSAGQMREASGSGGRTFCGILDHEQPAAATVPERADVHAEGRARHGALERRL